MSILFSIEILGINPEGLIFVNLIRYYKEGIIMEMKYVPTTCPYCGTGCGFNLVVGENKKVVGVAPWHRNPVNEGKLCPKGNYAWEFVNSPDRLTTPLIKKDGKFVEAIWDEAYKLIASKFKSYKGEEMACLSSARVSNEENYLMQKFARAVLKDAQISTTVPVSVTHRLSSAWPAHLDPVQ